MGPDPAGCVRHRDEPHALLYDLRGWRAAVHRRHVAEAAARTGKLSFRERYSLVENYAQPIINAAGAVKPLGIAFLGGRLEYGRLPWWAVLFAMLIIQAPAGDKLNWPFIQHWASSLPAAFEHAASSHAIQTDNPTAAGYHRGPNERQENLPLHFFAGLILLYALLSGLNVFLPQGDPLQPPSCHGRDARYVARHGARHAGGVFVIYGALGLLGLFLARALAFLRSGTALSPIGSAF